MQEYVRLLLEAGENFSKNPALIDRRGERVTDYKTFSLFMKKAASWIYKKGLTERSFIPVRLESSMEYAACVCGIWLSGHIAVPMGASFPAERVKYICLNCTLFSPTP